MTDLLANRLNLLARAKMRELGAEPTPGVMPALDLLLWGLDHSKRVELPHHETKYRSILWETAYGMMGWEDEENVLGYLLAPGEEDDPVLPRATRLAISCRDLTPELLVGVFAENLLSHLQNQGFVKLT